MKKIISLLVLSLIVPIYAIGNDEDITPIDNGDYFSFYNTEGEEITIMTNCAGDTATAKVYVDGVLTQYSVANVIVGRGLAPAV